MIKRRREIALAAGILLPLVLLGRPNDSCGGSGPLSFIRGNGAYIHDYGDTFDYNNSAVYTDLIIIAVISSVLLWLYFKPNKNRSIFQYIKSALYVLGVWVAIAVILFFADPGVCF
jgi:hypothetical protein